MKSGFKDKYNFGELDIGESVHIKGNPNNIRSAASNWGTRYGVWLKCEAKGPNCVLVTRVEKPISRARAKREEPNDRLKRLEDGLRFANVLLCRIDQKLNQILNS